MWMIHNLLNWIFFLRYLKIFILKKILKVNKTFTSEKKKSHFYLILLTIL